MLRLDRRVHSPHQVVVMKFAPHPSFLCHRQDGIASLLLLFAMSSFAVLGIGALSTSLGSAPAGKTFRLFTSVQEEALLKFIAPVVAPNAWKTENANGSYQFSMPVIVPETGGEEGGSTASWHAIDEIPGMAVCCESRTGVCNQRHVPGGGAPITDWTPGGSDAMWLALDLASRADATADANNAEIVTATVTSSTKAAVEGEAVACQLEWDGAVIAKGTALLRAQPRADGSGSGVSAQTVSGSMRLAVKTQ